MRTLIALSSFLALSAHAAPKCQPEFAKAISTLKGAALAERTQLAFALASELCKDALSLALQRNLAALAYAKPQERLALLSAIGRPEEAGADFELVCPAWPKLLSNADFFKDCDFAKQELLTAAEFGGTDARLASLTVVIFDALKRAGVDKKFARQFSRTVLLPLEAGPAPAPRDPKKDQERVRDVMKKAMDEKRE